MPKKSKRILQWEESRDKSVKEKIVKKETKDERKVELRAKTKNQQRYIEQLDTKQLIICTGPAGSGKTYCPIGYALQLLEDEEIDKFIVTRPMVECGRKLGAMPGDLSEKYGVYVRPIFDNILKFISQTQLDSYLHSGKIEFIPLELMRGSSIDHSLVLLDEAQNTEKAQMLMFLTRIGEGSIFVVCGDTEQNDASLHYKEYGDKFDGLGYAIRNLDEDEKFIGIVQMDETDIVRSKIVRLIISQWKQGS